MKYTKALSIVSGIMLILAVPPMWPYFYFQILRWVVSATAIYNGYTAYESKKTEWVVTMAVILVLFNPLFPIFLDKQTWVILDLVSAVIMFVWIAKSNPKAQWNS